MPDTAATAGLLVPVSDGERSSGVPAPRTVLATQASLDRHGVACFQAPVVDARALEKLQAGAKERFGAILSRVLLQRLLDSMRGEEHLKQLTRGLSTCWMPLLITLEQPEVL